ncbi:MAG: GIN domain-containing protein, partial [Lepagella sp.]
RILMVMVVAIATVMGVNAETLTQKVYKVSAFERIESSSIIKVKYTQASKYDVKVKYNEAGSRIFCFKQVGETIQLYTKEDPKKVRNASYLIEVYVTAPSLEYIGMSGSSTFTSGSITQSNRDLTVAQSGAAKFNVNQVCVKELDIRGSGAARFNGNITAKEDVSIKNSGSAMMSGTIKAPEVEIECSGAAKVTSTITTTDLDVEVSGAAYIDIKGSAKKAEYHASGSAQVSASGLRAGTGEVTASGAAKINSNIGNLYKRETSGVASITNR